MADAGWQLNIHPVDIYDVSTGQVAVAWIDRAANARKPYSIAIVIDNKGNEQSTDRLLARIETELKAKQGTTEKVTYGDKSITKFVLAKKAGDLMIHESYFVKLEGQMVATDDFETMKNCIDAAKKQSKDRLAATETYAKAMEHLKLKGKKDFDVEYYVRPIGIAKVLRAISKKAPTRQADMLRVLENQGFDKLAAVCGCLRVGSADFDLYHEGFVLAPGPLPKTVQILDFPNEASLSIPAWAGKNMASLTSMAWNIKEAFWKVEGLVDEVADAKDTFKLVIEGLQQDPLGPQIDIKNEVMPYLTKEIYSASDCVEPITPDSKRSLIAIRVTDSVKLTKVLDRAMKNEPDAVPLEVDGLRIWKVSRKDDDSVKLNVDETFNDFNTKKKKKEVEKSEEDPWLSNWAITVHKDFLMFSSHAEMIQQAIKTQQNGSEAAALGNESDFGRARDAIAKLSEGSPNCIWQIDRPDRSYQMQYELFRQDKLPQSRSMMASILDRLLHPKTEVRDQVQKVKGDRLPKFEVVKQYFMPSGTIVRTEKDGWSIHSFVLGQAKGGDKTPSTVETKPARTAERREVSASSK